MQYLTPMNNHDTLDLTLVQDAVLFDVEGWTDGYLEVDLVGDTWVTAVVEAKLGVSNKTSKLTSFQAPVVFSNTTGALQLGGVHGLAGIKFVGVIVTTANASDREVRPMLWVESQNERIRI